MRRCYAHVPAAENPLRPEAPKSPWSRRIPFPAPSGHFRIVLFLTGFFVWFLGLLIDGRFFFRSLSGFRSLWFRSLVIGGLFAFRLLFLVLCVPMVPWSPSFFVVGFSIGGFMSFVCPQVSFIDLLVSFSWLCFPSSFPVLHSFSLFRFSLRLRFPLPVLFPRAACVFLSVSWISIAVRPFRLRSPIPPLRITSSQCAIGRRRRAYRPRLSASSRTASSRVAWRRWSR